MNSLNDLEVVIEKKMKKLIKLTMNQPWFVTGFTDAEGCFTISIVKRNKELNVG